MSFIDIRSIAESSIGVLDVQYKPSTLKERPMTGKFLGQMHYATDVGLFAIWDGTKWREFASVDTLKGTLNALYGRQSVSLRKFTETKGTHIIANARRHVRLKVLDAWVTVSDNSDVEQSVEVLGITKPLEIAPSYKAGVSIPLTIVENEINFFRPIKVNVSSNRRVVVELLCESMETPEETPKTKVETEV